MNEHYPSEYNEMVEFIESNDTEVVAKIFSEKYVHKKTIEKILEDAEGAAEYAEERGNWAEYDGIMHLVDELRSEMYD